MDALEPVSARYTPVDEKMIVSLMRSGCPAVQMVPVYSYIAGEKSNKVPTFLLKPLDVSLSVPEEMIYRMGEGCDDFKWLMSCVKLFRCVMLEKDVSCLSGEARILNEL